MLDHGAGVFEAAMRGVYAMESMRREPAAHASYPKVTSHHLCRYGWEFLGGARRIQAPLANGVHSMALGVDMRLGFAA